jgi:hypothetical protein
MTGASRVRSVTLGGCHAHLYNPPFPEPLTGSRASGGTLGPELS